jgi:NADH-quinone oxidoreductase subunit G
MIEVEVDGRKVQVPEGSTLMDATRKLDIYVPHFCYHRKLSIAANCRMCLVDVEKAPKPLPACATPATQGMIVHTANAKAKQAQKGVMEFLLINHPLDCPICDQGGECQLQDLAVGYGGSASRYVEAKRVVFHKGIGPLVAAEEMTRCIHCTRCVRFGQEIAGIMELGMAGRGEHAEILAFVDRTVDSELSGNMIDLCPVGALTSKPFRYTARTWELSRRRSVSPHDSLGSNLVVQVKNQRVMRVVPLENEEVNECWISDRDRFSYEGLYAADRLQRPMLKQGGQWREVDWTQAIEYVAGALQGVKQAHGAGHIGALASPGSTLEELFLLGRLMRAFGSENVDFRVRQSDFSADALRSGAPFLGMPIAALNKLDRVLLVGSFLRKDHPLLAARIRAATKRGCQVNVLHAADDDLLMPVANKRIVAPGAWVSALAEICTAVAQLKHVDAPAAGSSPREAAQRIAANLVGGQSRAILLGNAAADHPHAAQLLAWSQWLAEQTGASIGVIGAAANSVGGYLANAFPMHGGLNARSMVEQPRKAYLLWNFEPEYDHANPAATIRALAQAETVIAFSAFRNGALEYADAILPITPFTETSGTFVNCEGRVQSFNGTVKPFGDARPGWKVLRVLANQLGLAGFEYDSPEAVRAQAIPVDVAARLSNRIELQPQPVVAPGGLERLADVSIYAVDPIVRRSEPLQKTRDARPARASANSRTLARLGLRPGDKTRVRQGDASALLECAVDEGVADEVVRVPAGHASTSTLGAMFGTLVLEKA